MRVEGVQPPAVASDPALRRPLEAPAAKRCGLRVFPPAPPSLRGCQGTNQAAQLRLPGRVTEGKGGSGALSPAVKIIAEQWGGRRLMQLITCISPCVRADRSEAAPDPARMQEHVQA